MATEKPQIPESAYAALYLDNNQFTIAECGAEKILFHQKSTQPRTAHQQILEWFKKQSQERELKFVGLALTGTNDLKKLAASLWLKLDIVPYSFDKVNSPDKKKLEKLAHEVKSSFNEENVVTIPLTEDNEVIINPFLVGLEDYQQVTPPDEFAELIRQSDNFSGRRISFFNATPRGGGVAIMRHAQMRLYRLLGVDAHWHVLEEKEEAFKVTKGKFHNVLQAVTDPQILLTQEDKKLYNSWIRTNADIFKNEFAKSDVIVIDDPQPSGLVPHIRKKYPHKAVIYRSHIQLEADLVKSPNTPQYTTWNFIWRNIQSCDLFVTQPVEKFVPPQIPRDKLVTSPPSTDPLDGLNKKLTPRQKNYYHKLFDKKLLELGQAPLDLTRPYFIQIARFDPSKGFPDAIRAYCHLREEMETKNVKLPIPQLVLVGHGSVDDPDAAPIFNLLREMLKKEPYAQYRQDIKMARLPHIDQLFNTLLRDAKVALQLSHKEGFEFKVTEALMKGVPVVSYQAGGIPLQIKDHKNGFVVKQVGNTQEVSRYLWTLLTDSVTYKQMSENARRHYRKDVSTVSLATAWLSMANQLTSQADF